jgi:hypothetical protein
VIRIIICAVLLLQYKENTNEKQGEKWQSARRLRHQLNQLVFHGSVEEKMFDPSLTECPITLNWFGLTLSLNFYILPESPRNKGGIAPATCNNLRRFQIVEQIFPGKILAPFHTEHLTKH